MTDLIRDELHRIAEEFGKLLGTSYLAEKTTPEELVQRFGLTTKQAKNWLKTEPYYDKSILDLSDDSYHDSPNRRKVNRTKKHNINKCMSQLYGNNDSKIFFLNPWRRETQGTTAVL